MPRITYHEFRPGKWVKLVDGKAVGRATPAEVAAWKKEQVAPARIWEDVVATASGPPSGKVKSTRPPLEAELPAESGTPSESSESTLWQDLVKQSKRPARAEGPPKPRPRQEDTAWTEQAQIWEDVVKRARRPGPGAERQPAQKAPIPPRPAPEVEAKPAVKAVPAPPSRSETVCSPSATKPADKGSITQKPSAAEVVSKSTGRGRRKTAAAKPKEKTAALSKAPAAEPTPKPTAPAKRTAKAEAKPRREATSARRALPAAAQPGPKVRAAKAIRERPAAKAAIPKSRSGSAAVSRRTTGKSKTPATQEQPNPLYLWIAAAQSDDPIAAVRTGLARYQERFNHVAEVVLCHSSDLPTLEEAKLPVDLREGKSLAPHNFWIGSK
jgi:hypothetical protein